MSTKIHVDNLAAATTESDLTSLFSAYGNVMQVNIPVDRTNQRSRGFGFVTMVTSEGARSAIQGLNGRKVDACALIVSEAWPDEERTSSTDGPRSPLRLASHLF
jgi:RNA recognition motif-containing protein